jgi:hypothetical protein
MYLISFLRILPSPHCMYLPRVSLSLRLHALAAQDGQARLLTMSTVPSPLCLRQAEQDQDLWAGRLLGSHPSPRGSSSTGKFAVSPASSPSPEECGSPRHSLAKSYGHSILCYAIFIHPEPKPCRRPGTESIAGWAYVYSHQRRLRPQQSHPSLTTYCQRRQRARTQPIIENPSVATERLILHSPRAQSITVRYVYSSYLFYFILAFVIRRICFLHDPDAYPPTTCSLQRQVTRWQH